MLCVSLHNVVEKPKAADTDVAPELEAAMRVMYLSSFAMRGGQS